jgi:azurin
MNISTYTKCLATIAVAAMIAACAPNGEVTETAPSPAPDTVTETPPPENGFTIEIGGDDNMRFDVTEFTVEAGQHVTIVFNNVGTMPKESMGHNLVVLQMGVDKMDFANAAQRHVRNEYIPPEREDEVIAATRLLGPGESDTITFIAPDETGDYDYICSFPGHTPAGMVGIMTVE